MKNSNKTNIISNNLCKSFDKKLILDSINLEINSSSCYALLGRNGSGKTTLINCLLNLILPDNGTISIKGMNYHENNYQIKKIIGVVAEENPLIPEFTGQQYLKFIGLLHEIPENRLKENIDSIVNFFFGDTLVLEKAISKYSTGMKKLLGLCAAVLHRPYILILDEPFSGLDIVSANKVVEFLKFYLTIERIIFVLVT